MVQKLSFVRAASPTSRQSIIRTWHIDLLKKYRAPVVLINTQILQIQRLTMPRLVQKSGLTLLVVSLLLSLALAQGGRSQERPVTSKKRIRISRSLAQILLAPSTQGILPNRTKLKALVWIYSPRTMTYPWSTK